MVIWVVGLSGAGKTVVGKQLRDKLRSMKRPAVFLDGDIFRNIMGNDLGHTLEDRRKNAERICRHCQYLEQQDVDVIFAVLSLFHESQEWNRNNFSRYFEVYLEVSFDTLLKRDPKGLYRKALSGEIKNVAGIDVPFTPPVNPDMIINNDRDRDNYDDIVDLIVGELQSKGYLQ